MTHLSIFKSQMIYGLGNPRACLNVCCTFPFLQPWTTVIKPSILTNSDQP